MTWPALTPASGWGREVKSQFNYRRDDWSCDTGVTWSDLYVVSYVGGTDWGASGTYFNDKPWSEIEAATWGNWSRYLPGGSEFERTQTNGRTFSGAVSLTALGSSVTLGATTKYDCSAVIKIKFGNQYSHYYLYDNCSCPSTPYKVV